MHRYGSTMSLCTLVEIILLLCVFGKGNTSAIARPLNCTDMVSLSGFGYTTYQTCLPEQQCIRLEVNVSYNFFMERDNGTAVLGQCVSISSKLCSGTCEAVFNSFNTKLQGATAGIFDEFLLTNCTSTCCDWNWCNNNTVEDIRSGDFLKSIENVTPMTIKSTSNSPEHALTGMWVWFAGVAITVRMLICAN